VASPQGARAGGVEVKSQIPLPLEANVTRAEIVALTEALKSVPDGTPLAEAARYVGDAAEARGCSFEVARFAEAMVAAMIKIGGRP